MIKKTGNKLVDLYDIFTDSLTKAELKKSKLTKEILNFENKWSCSKTRHFLNNLCSHEEVVYFECGIARGSTLLSALWKNSTKAYACDSWLETKLGKNSYEKFEQNCKMFGNYIDNCNITLFNGSCWNIIGEHEEAFSPKPNVFFYDAGHSVNDHKRAVSHFLPILDDAFILIVDDFNDDRVNQGTILGLEEVHKTGQAKLLGSFQLLGFPPHAYIWKEEQRKPDSKWTDNERWGNAIWVGLFEKNKKEDV